MVSATHRVFVVSHEKVRSVAVCELQATVTLTLTLTTLTLTLTLALALRGD